MNEQLRRLAGYFNRALFCCLLICLVLFFIVAKQSSFQETVTDNSFLYTMNYDVSSLSDHSSAQIKYGHRLFTQTNQMLGAFSDSTQQIYNSALSCDNCHLNAGTQAYAMPMIGVSKVFPQFRGRENKIGTLEERINGCFERSMNGVVLEESSAEMKALIAYIDWLSRYVQKDEKLIRRGLKSIEIPARKVDLSNGEAVFQRECTRCHGENGQGQLLADQSDYEYPPLWGSQSYNNGAGMTRVITAASFIKYNMPFGIDYREPLLSDEDAYDVAGYINQQKRPDKADREVDFPDLKKKPVSTPYGPYADDFSIAQHQLGPFQPIMRFYEEEFGIKKTK